MSNTMLRSLKTKKLSNFFFYKVLQKSRKYAIETRVFRANNNIDRALLAEWDNWFWLGVCWIEMKNLSERGLKAIWLRRKTRGRKKKRKKWEKKKIYEAKSSHYYTASIYPKVIRIGGLLFTCCCFAVALFLFFLCVFSFFLFYLLYFVVCLFFWYFLLLLPFFFFFFFFFCLRFKHAFLDGVSLVGY